MFVVGGESLIDLVSQPLGTDGVIHMDAHAGGSPYNCAIALSRLGNSTGFLCPISTDGLGDYLMKPLTDAGVVPLLEERVSAPTSLAVVTLNEKREARYQFYRSADRAFTEGKLLAALPQRPLFYQIGGFCAILEDDAQVWASVAGAAAERGAVISIDPNVRPTLVDDFEAYKRRLEVFFALAHIIKVSREDLESLDPGMSVEAHAADLLLKPNCELVVVTLGDEGSRAFTRSGEARAGIFSPPEFGDTVGAGDSLMAGIASRIAERGDLEPGRMGQLDDAALRDVLEFGAIVAGLNCAHMGCHPPSRAEVEAVLSAR